MFKVSVNVAVTCYDLMTSKVRFMTYLGAIITLTCTWMFSAQAISSQPIGFKPRLHYSLDAAEGPVALLGHDAVFQCTGLTNTNVQWKKDGITIASITTSNTNERRKSRHKKHTYDMTKSHQKRRRIRSTEKETLPQKPLTHTSTTTLPQYSNFDNSKLLANISSDNFTWLSNGSLHIRNVNDAHAGEYSCFTEDQFGKLLRRKFYLKIAKLPQCTIQPTSQSLNIGDTARIKCSTNSILNVTYEWTKDGQPLPHNNKRYVYLPTGVLQIFKVTPEDSGSYVCNVKNIMGRTSSGGSELTVLPSGKHVASVGKLKFKYRPQNLTVSPPYQSALFECFADEVANITYGWVKDDGNSRICLGSSCIVQELHNTLWFGDISPMSNGKYTCIIRKDVEGAKLIVASASAYLKVLEKPSVTVKRGTQKILRLSQTTTLACEARGNPKPSTYWMKDGVIIEENDHFVDRKRIQNIDGKSFLKITTLRHEDFGYYQCIGENSVGSFAAGVKLNAISNENIPSPMNVKAKAISDKEIVVEWTRPNMTKRINAFTIEFAQHDSEDVNYLVQGTDAVKYNKTLTGLRPHTEYSIEITVYTDWGVSRPSKIVKSRTRESVPTGVVDHKEIKAVAVNSTAILLSWLSLPRPLQSGVVTKYKVLFTNELNTQTENFIEVNTRQKPDDVAGVSEYALIPGLRPGHNYGMTVKAATKVGYGPESEFVDLTLPHKQQPNCVPESESSIVYARGEFNNVKNYVKIFWKLRNSSDYVKLVNVTLTLADNVVASQSFEPSTNVATFDSVDLMKAYIVTVKLINKENKTCEIHSFALLPGEETKTTHAMPKDLNATATKPGCINMAWSYDDEKNDDKSTVFSVRYKLHDSMPHRRIFKYVNSTEKQHEVCGLQPWSGYEFAVAAVTTPEIWTAYDDSFYTKLGRIVLTIEEKPGSPSEFFCKDQLQGKVECVWKSPEKPNGEITGYTLMYKDLNEGVAKSNNTKSTHIAQECLKPNTQYDFQVFAINNAGHGGFSVIQSLVVSKYDVSKTNCSFAITDLDAEMDKPPLFRTIAIVVGIALFCVVICILLMRLFLPETCKICEKAGCKKTAKQLGKNGSSKTEGIASKQNGHIVKKNGFHKDNVELSEQRINLLSNGNNSIVHCNGNGYRHSTKMNGFHKSPPKSTSIKYETSSMKSHEPTTRNGFKKSKSEKKCLMAVPDEAKETHSGCPRVVLSVPIPRHTSKSTSSDTATFHAHSEHSRSSSGTN